MSRSTDGSISLEKSEMTLSVDVAVSNADWYTFVGVVVGFWVGDLVIPL